MLAFLGALNQNYKVIDMFKSVFENISSLKHGALPADAVKKLLQVFQTTSVDDFNELFANMLKQLTNAEIQTAINPSYVITLNAQGAAVLGNDMKSVKFTLEYADKAYHNFICEGKWDACLQKPPGASTFVAAGVPLQPPSSDHPPPTGHKMPASTAAVITESTSAPCHEIVLKFQRIGPFILMVAVLLMAPNLTIFVEHGPVFNDFGHRRVVILIFDNSPFHRNCFDK